MLVHMPVSSPSLPNLAIERLAETLRRSGTQCNTLYGTLLFDQPLPVWLRNDSIAPAFFAPSYYDETVDSWMARIFEHMSIHVPHVPLSEYHDLFLSCMKAAERCLSACIDRIQGSNADVVGFSIGFDAQRLPSAALARVLKRKLPDIKTVAGGTACDGVMGQQLLKWFPDFDAVCSGEADETIIKIVHRLLGQTSVSVPGTRFRGHDESVLEKEADVEDHLISSTLDLPTPNYKGFFEQAEESSQQEVAVYRTVMYEGSRGCWYGLKNHCTFCGIRPVDFPYRITTARHFLKGMQELQRDYDPDLIYLTDAILSREAFSEVLPALSDMRRAGELKAKIFAETKSNLTPQEVHALALANVSVIQPGIETFLSSSLRRMRKGATGIQQIALLKWCRAFGVTPIYSLLIGIPGETETEQFQLADICSLLRHLPPPLGTNKLGIHRFSPYFDNPSAYGIERIMPFDYQRLIYRLPDNELLSLCYEFNHTQRAYEQMPTGEAANLIKEEVLIWREHFASTKLMQLSQGERVLILREKEKKSTVLTFEGAAAFVLENTHHPSGLQRLLAEGSDFSQREIEEAISDLRDLELLIYLDNRYLNLAVHSQPLLAIRKQSQKIAIRPINSDGAILVA